VLDGTVVNLALPGMVRDLNSTPTNAVWVVSAYQLATLSLLLPLASLGDLVGYRRVYLVGATVFTLASAACSLSHSLTMLTLARAVQGAGAAGIMAVNSALVRLTYPSRMLGRGIALNSVVVATASVAGPPVAASILSIASWPWLFAINVPLGIALVVLGRRALPSNAEAPPVGLNLSPLEVVLNAGMFITLFLGADIIGASAGSGARPVGTLAGAGLLGASVLVGGIYVLSQRRRAVPLLPIDLLRITIFRLSMATSVCAFAAQTLAYVALPFLFLDTWHFSAMQGGMLLACWPLAIIVAAPQAGRLIARYPGGLLSAVGLALLAAGLALLAVSASSAQPVGIWWQLALCGLGFGIFQSPNNHTIITSAPVKRSGAASGMLGTARLTGQSLGAVLLGGVFSLAGVDHSHAPRIALTLAAVFAAAASVFSALRVKHAVR